ncbi:DUF805 domain-containing protein [Micrococcus sp. HG099]|uniref:DUF805 domain-containing protein n=1 Tax=Micrococcus sp. HG099 TaxID=2969755 RepID=UPI00215B71D0|nr:DUF805 domain-containing protein [Micrococcus sp. HG099]MCR8675148.1 DUF805 domain-containing protein [Micrococcus sp. HG099]
MPDSRTSRGILTADLRIDLRAPPWTGRGRTGRLAFFQVMAWLLLASCLMQFVFYQLGATGHLGGAGWLGAPLFSAEPAFSRHPDVPAATAAFQWVSNALALAHVLPTLALTARRLRDAGFHVAWTLLAFVPGLGSLVLFCLLIQPTGRRFP